MSPPKRLRVEDGAPGPVNTATVARKPTRHPSTPPAWCRSWSGYGLASIVNRGVERPRAEASSGGTRARARATSRSGSLAPVRHRSGSLAPVRRHRPPGDGGEGGGGGPGGSASSQPPEGPSLARGSGTYRRRTTPAMTCGPRGTRRGRRWTAPRTRGFTGTQRSPQGGTDRGAYPSAANARPSGGIEPGAGGVETGCFDGHAQGVSKARIESALRQGSISPLRTSPGGRWRHDSVGTATSPLVPSSGFWMTGPSSSERRLSISASSGCRISVGYVSAVYGPRNRLPSKWIMWPGESATHTSVSHERYTATLMSQSAVPNDWITISASGIT